MNANPISNADARRLRTCRPHRIIYCRTRWSNTELGSAFWSLLPCHFPCEGSERMDPCLQQAVAASSTMERPGRLRLPVYCTYLETVPVIMLDCPFRSGIGDVLNIPTAYVEKIPIPAGVLHAPNKDSLILHHPAQAAQPRSPQSGRGGEK